MILLTMINSQKAKARENAKKAAFDELLFNAQTYDNYPYSKHDILHPVNIMLDPVLSRLEKQKSWLKDHQNKIKVYYDQYDEDGRLESIYDDWLTPGDAYPDSKDVKLDCIEDPFRVLSRPENAKYSFLKNHILKSVVITEADQMPF